MRAIEENRTPTFWATTRRADLYATIAMERAGDGNRTRRVSAGNRTLHLGAAPAKWTSAGSSTPWDLLARRVSRCFVRPARITTAAVNVVARACSMSDHTAAFISGTRSPRRGRARGRAVQVHRAKRSLGTNVAWMPLERLLAERTDERLQSLRVMMLRVLGGCQQLQVFQRIVLLVLVLVVDFFIAAKRTTQVLLHHETMLSYDRPIGEPKSNVRVPGRVVSGEDLERHVPGVLLTELKVNRLRTK